VSGARGAVAACALVVLAALAFPERGAAPAAAPGGLTRVGDERTVGKNRTGEECRLRLVESEPDRRGFQRFGLYCEGWTQPSGEIRRFRVPRAFQVEKLLTDSGFLRAMEARVGGCSALEPTTLASGAPAVLRECRRIQGEWRVLVLGAVIGSWAYGLETFPTNLPVLELALEVLEGKRAADQPGTAPVSAAIRRAETVVGASGRLVGIQDVGAHATLYRLGQLQDWAAHYPESEATFRRVLDIEERLLDRAAPASGMTLAWIALTVSHQGRFTEADQIYARAEPLVKGALSVHDYPHYLTFRSLSEWRRDRPEQALRYADEAVRARGTRGRESAGMAHSLVALARAQTGLKRLDEAQQSASRAAAILDTPGPRPEFRLWWAGETWEALGEIHLEQKRYADARVAFQRALDRRRLLLGDSVRTAAVLRALGRLARLEGDLPRALAAFRETARIQATDRPTRERTRPDNMVGYLDTLFAVARSSSDRREALLAEAFAAAQIPRGGDTARAVTQMAARLSATDPAVRAAAREFQEAASARDRLRRDLAAETTREPDKREPGREERLKSDLREAEEKIALLEGRLQAELPRYAQLTAPRPLAVGELTTLLRPGEALVAFLPTGQATYVFAVRDGRTHAHRASVTAAELDRLVRTLRASVEPVGRRIGPFDTAVARRLYDLLLAPLADRLGGVTHLIAVPAGPLLSVPLGVLVTGPTAGPAAGDFDYRRTPWLAREMAISVVPAVASLRSLRQMAGRSAAPRPFIGFGDPAFAGAPGDARSAVALAELCRQDDPVDADLLRGLPRLAETAGELASIARSLGAEPGSVRLGADASERTVRATDLARYRVVAFATHGLLPGELRCKSQPALVLTPPATPSAHDDGLLDAAEVAQLKLDADWVVLSACNTAGPEGKLGGESLSGLARAFFYAGARALLVSHWAVESQATVALTTTTFAAQAKDAALGRAEALRRAQLALGGDRDTSHPFYWAPFVLVGDGGVLAP